MTATTPSVGTREGAPNSCVNLRFGADSEVLKDLQFNLISMIICAAIGVGIIGLYAPENVGRRDSIADLSSFWALFLILVTPLILRLSIKAKRCCADLGIQSLDFISLNGKSYDALLIEIDRVALHRTRAGKLMRVTVRHVTGKIRIFGISDLDGFANALVERVPSYTIVKDKWSIFNSSSRKITAAVSIVTMSVYVGARLAGVSLDTMSLLMLPINVLACHPR